MGRDVMDDRKRALVLGKFKFLYQDDCEELETTDKFQLAVVQNKLLGPVIYRDKDGKEEAVLQIYGQSRPEGEGFSDPDIKIPGALDIFTVVWTNPFGEISVDQDIKLFEFCDIQKYSSYNDGPKSKEFCQFHTSSTSKELDGFDSAIFWSAGLLWKHFKTCGVEKWDIEFRDLVTHYRNWKDWAHEVHNLPDRDKNKVGKFSNNRYSGPASTSTYYSRPKQSGSGRSASGVNPPTPPPSATKKPLMPVKFTEPTAMAAFNPCSPPPVLQAPPPGQSITVPIAAADGTITQVQLITMPATPAATPESAGGVGRFKYVNPHYPPPSLAQPPPARHSPNSGWTTAVDEFLGRPKSRVSTGGSSTSLRDRSPLVRELVPLHSSSPKSSRARALKELKEKKETPPAKEGKRFKPKSVIRAPSPTVGAEVNDLDILPEKSLYTGVLQDWRGKFGFLSCQQITGKIFLHSKDIKHGRDLVAEGRLVTFQVLHQEKSVVGAKAVNATILESG